MLLENQYGVQALFVLTSEWERVRQSLNLLLRATSPNLKDKFCSETAAIIKYKLVQNVTPTESILSSANTNLDLDALP